MGTSQYNNLENIFEKGRLMLLTEEFGMIKADKLTCLFATESIDLGPFHDASEESWHEILKEGDELYFSIGIKLPSASADLWLAKRVFIPETAESTESRLGVVLRSIHPASRERALAAFLCPPFGIVPLHIFAFGYEPKIAWPLKVGERFWVEIIKEKTENAETYRVGRVVRSDDSCFTINLAGIKTSIPKVYRWQFEQEFSRTGLVSLEHVLAVRNMCSTPGFADESSLGDSTELSRRNCATVSGESAQKFLQVILNDNELLSKIIAKHGEEFRKYYGNCYGTQLNTSKRCPSPLVEEPDE